MPENATKQNSILRALGSLMPRRKSAPPRDGRIIQPWREDSLVNHPTLGLTPARARQLLQAADSGSPKLQYELYSEMLQKWPRLAAVEATRRLALTGLEWEVAPTVNARSNAATPDNQDAIVDYCSETLAGLPCLRDTLDFLASAIGHGIAVAELVWEQSTLVDIVPVPYTRLVADRDEPWRLRVLTEDEPTEGIALDEKPNKWIIHQPRTKPGRPFTGNSYLATRYATPVDLSDHAELQEILEARVLDVAEYRAWNGSPLVNDIPSRVKTVYARAHEWMRAVRDGRSELPATLSTNETLRTQQAPLYSSTPRTFTHDELDGV